jgi:hypothetical protein
MLVMSLPATAIADASAKLDSPQALQLRAAERQERSDSDKERYEANETTIAERDLESAKLRLSVTMDAWQRAIRENHPAEAGSWAKDHYDAMAAERDAEGRYLSHKAGRDLARADFRRDADLVHMLETRVQNLSAQR